MERAFALMASPVVSLTSGFGTLMNRRKVYLFTARKIATVLITCEPVNSELVNYVIQYGSDTTKMINVLK